MGTMRVASIALACSLALACGGESDPGTGNGNSNGNGVNGGSNCSGGQFDLEWTRDRSGQASGDCVVTTVSDTNGMIPGEYIISAIEEGPGDDVAVTLRINRDTLAPIQAILSLGDDIGCNESDVFMMGNFEGALTFERRDADGFDLAIVVNMACTDETGAELVNFEVQLTGTVSGSRELD